MKQVLFLISALYLLAAAGTDSDFDGVDDLTDRCAQTPFSETVDAYGCPVRHSTLAYEIGLGGSYATGTYGGDQTIDSLSGDFNAAMYGTRFFASAALSYYFQGAYDPTVATYDNGGISDLYLSAGYAFYLSEDASLTPALQVKLPTADEGLGTGETDYGASLQALKRFERMDLFAFAGYIITGDAPTATYEDVVYGSAGAAYTGQYGIYASISYDYSQSYIAGQVPLEALSFYGSFALYDTLYLRVQYSAGMSETAAQHAGSVMIVKRF